MSTEKGAQNGDASPFESGGGIHRIASGFSFGFWYVDPEGRTVFANEVVATMLGCTAEEMADAKLEEFLLPEERPTIMGAIRSGAVMRGRNRRMRLRRGNGIDRWFRIEVVPTHGIPDAPNGAFVVLTDTTSQRRSEAASAYLSSLVATSDDAIFGIDLEGRITSWNGGAERMFGYTYEEVVGHSCDMLVPSDQLSQLERIREIVAEGGSIESMYVTGIRKDFSRVEVALSGTPVFDANDEVVGYSKVARDVTARRRAAETQMRLAAIVESSDDAIISKDLDGIVQTWNAGAERVFGYRATEAIGRSIRFLIPDELQEEEDRMLETLRHGGRVDHFLTVRRRKDGTLIDVSVSASPIRSLDGKVVGISKIARDVSSRIVGRPDHERRIAKLQRDPQSRASGADVGS